MPSVAQLVAHTVTHKRFHSLADITDTDLRGLFEDSDYVADASIRTPVLLALRMQKPLLVEGEPGTGKTELAKTLTNGLHTDLIRLQCYEGLTAEQALYEWNYTKQLLALQTDSPSVEDSVFTEEYLLKRPLVQALLNGGDRPPVLLIDEVDRADEEFEALLLEFLAEFQVSIPEYGTVTADEPPVVVISSNRTRALSDALKRRCLYLHLTPPSFQKEKTIVERKVPELDDAVTEQLCSITQQLREQPLRKQPGIAETLDWARAVDTLSLDETLLSVDDVERTLGCLLKESEDIERMDETLLRTLVKSTEGDTDARNG